MERGISVLVNDDNYFLYFPSAQPQELITCKFWWVIIYIGVSGVRVCDFLTCQKWILLLPDEHGDCNFSSLSGSFYHYYGFIGTLSIIHEQLEFKSVVEVADPCHSFCMVVFLSGMNRLHAKFHNSTKKDVYVVWDKLTWFGKFNISCWICTAWKRCVKGSGR